MTRAEQERLVGNYLRGEMSAAQEQEFFIQVALDSDLRQTLKAFRVVDTAIQKHREAIAPNHAESYNKLMAMLGASATEPAALVGTSAGLLQRGLGFLGGRFFSWTSAIVATGALTVGAFIVGPAVYQSEKGTNAAQVEAASEEALPATLDSIASTSEGEQNAQRIAEQPGEEITTGASKEEITGLSAANLSATKKQELKLNPAAIAAEARKKNPAQQPMEEASTSAQDPFAAMMQEIASQKPTATPTSSKKKGVKVVYKSLDNSTQDTIKLNVQFDGNGIKKKQGQDE